VTHKYAVDGHGSIVCARWLDKDLATLCQHAQSTKGSGEHMLFYWS
jgi:hypothetical protein